MKPSKAAQRYACFRWGHNVTYAVNSYEVDVAETIMKVIASTYDAGRRAERRAKGRKRK